MSPAGRALLAELTTYDDTAALAVGERLRRQGLAPALVAAAMTQARLRARAVAKLGPDAERMLFTADGLEQATRREVADRRAARLVAAGARRVADLGCGIGADALAFARAGLEVRAVERDPATAAVARANVRSAGLAHLVEVVEADVTQVGLAGCDAAYLDPARRGEGRRRYDPQQWSPPWEFVLGVAGQIPRTAAKVAPGIDHALVPPGAEAEWVSVDGDVVEAGVWFGPLAGSWPRRAALLPSGATVAGPAVPPPAAAAPGPYLYEPDGAVIRAGLVAEAAAEVDGWLVDPTIAYVSAGRHVPTALMTAYLVHETAPFSQRRVVQMLRARGAGDVVVKKRGTAVVPEQLRARVLPALPERGRGPAVTVVLTRVLGKHTALVVERL
ncbi:methyltransferase domain-containing protein [Motilibacter sp. K478]|nr:methyltransferase domain-containing protein [Motilibacter aurantiacus]